MLLPTKTLSPARSLVGIGAALLRLLDEPKPVSRVWSEYKRAQQAAPDAPTVTFAWFVLGLDLLFLLRLIRLSHNRLVRDDPSAVQQPS
jgi:hypothetical protein